MTDAPCQHPCQHNLSYAVLSLHHQPVISLLLSLPLTQSLAPTKLPLPCGEYARVLPFYLFLSCSINLSVQPDAGRASCIPNTKNNHFSVTGVGGAGKGCASVRMGGGGGWGILIAHRHKTKPPLLQLQHRGRSAEE